LLFHTIFVLPFQTNPCVAVIRGTRAGIYSVLAALNYQNNNESAAQEFLSLALQEDYSYSLALLLKRVIGAGWPTGAFAKMTEELHPKVVEGLDDTPIE
jgi:hypothetical protein